MSLTSLSDNLTALVGQAGQSVVAVQARSRFDSSGVHWTPGVVVTAAHTIRRDDGIRVVTAAGAAVDAELAGHDAGSDIAVLRVKDLAAPLVNKDRGGELRPGQLAVAIGRSKDSPIAALGVIGSLSGPSSTWRGGRLDRVIRLSLDLHPGAAGGAVTDTEGRFIGIATQVFSRFSVFAIPPETVDRVTANLLAHGRIPRGYLGAGLQPIAIPEHLGNKLGLSSGTGLIAMSVEADAPAGRAGMSIGDILIELGGRALAKPESVQEILDSESVGKTIPARIIRGGNPLSIDITVGERPRRG